MMENYAATLPDATGISFPTGRGGFRQKAAHINFPKKCGI